MGKRKWEKEDTFNLFIKNKKKASVLIADRLHLKSAIFIQARACEYSSQLKGRGNKLYLKSLSVSLVLINTLN